MKVDWNFDEFYYFTEQLKNMSRFEREMGYAAKEIASALLRSIKSLTPIGDTWQLINGWNGNNLAVRRVGEELEVLLVNTDEKAVWVNDGHRAYNQFGGPYKIHTRVKVTSPHRWQKGNPDLYVFGHFFVERGILQVSNTKVVEQIILKKLHKWWEGCFYG